MNEARKHKAPDECRLCKRFKDDCGTPERGLRGCKEFKADGPGEKLLHDMFYEDEYNNRKLRIAFETDYYPILKVLNDLALRKKDLEECFDLSEEEAEKYTDMCGDLAEIIEEKLVEL